MKILDNFIVIVFLLAFVLFISTFLFNSYFGIKLCQKRLEKTFNKKILKRAGFSSLSKRFFDFCFDLFVFWIFFYYKDGVFLAIQTVLGGEFRWIRRQAFFWEECCQILI